MRSLLFLCLITCGHFAAGQDFLQFSYGLKNGLVDSHVRCITEDSRGFMWFGTNEGLSRFDGLNFKNYIAKPDSASLPSNFIEQMLETKYGHLTMVVGQSCTLVSMNTLNGRFYTPRDFTDRRACGIYKLAPNKFLVATPDSSFLVDEDLQIVAALNLPRLGGKPVTFSAKIDDDTYLVVSTASGRNKYYLYNLRTNTYGQASFSLPTQGLQHLIFSFYDSTHQWLYFADYFTGIYRYSRAGVLLAHWPMRGRTRVDPLNDSTLWVGGSVDQAGALLLNSNNRQVVPAVVAGSLAFDAHILFTDRQGHHWVGTERGVTKFVSNPGVIQTFTAFPDSPCNGCVPLGVRKGADNQFYLSFFLVPNIYKLDAKKNEWVLFSDRLNTGPWCMNSAGAELVFTGGQTMRYATFDPRTGEIKFSSDFLKKYFPAADILILAFQHSNGDRWFSANKGGGFVRIEAKDGRIQHYTKDGPQGKFTHGYYSRYAEDRFGNLWFSVNKTPRLLRWEKISDRFSEVSLDTVPGAEGISFRGVNDIALDQEDKLWVGYDGTGLAQYDYERNQLIHYSRLQGLPSDYVTALALDGTNRVWINTHNGLSCLLPEENRIRNFTQADGLAEDRFINGFVSFDSTSNLVWVGGLSSVMRFNPDTLLALTTPAPSIYIDELYVNGKQRELSDKGTMRLLQNENSVQFRFVAVTTTSKPLQFRYLLEGHDAHWIENTPGTVVSYSNLEPGSYTFQVRARFHGDDKILYSATPLSFVVATPFFRTEWFRVSVALAGTFTLLSLFRLYYAKKHEKERFQLGQQHAVEKERTRIALDMHDDFGASLSRIKFISEKLKITGHLPSDLGVYLDKISKYSDEMAEKMNEIVWALNERYDTVSDLVSFSRAYAADYLNQHHIKLDFQSTEKPELKISGEARRNIFLVMKEALHNTVKHAEASHVCISIHIDHNILFTISDNGKGVTLNSIRPFANGLVNMRKRTEAVGGVFEIENAPVGTTIKIEVPL